MVYVFHEPAITCIWLPSEHIGGKYDEVVHHEGDPCTATRRAIVRAAAEIGKGMPQQQPAAECVLEDNYYKTQAEAEERGRAAAEIGRQMEGGAA